MNPSTTDLLSRFLTPSAGGMTVLEALASLGIAYLGGVLASLTPCVYPMIPITIGVVGGLGSSDEAGGGKRAWHEVWIRALSYVGGMATVYSFLGVLAGLSGRVFGTITGNSSVYLTLGIFITFASLAMMDVIPFDPQRLWEKFLHRLRRGHRVASPPPGAHRSQSLFGAFALGASSGLVAAPCTTPILTSILAYIAKTQSVGMGLALMIAFSFGLGTLLVLIGTFAGSLRFLPRSGNWMKVIKTASGLILLLFAQYLIYRAGQLRS